MDEARLSERAETELRTELQGEATQLRDQLRDLDQDESALDYDDNFADSGQVAAEQGENQGLAAQLRDQLDDVERALAKLDDGTYGHCEVCGEPISDARLEVMPAARYCIEHAG